MERLAVLGIGVNRLLENEDRYISPARELFKMEVNITELPLGGQQI